VTSRGPWSDKWFAPWGTPGTDLEDTFAIGLSQSTRASTYGFFIASRRAGARLSHFTRGIRMGMDTEEFAPRK
jgi:hypothetical protein